MRNKIVQKMCVAALFTAIGYVLTAFAVIPYGAQGGYFNLGDIFIYLGAAFLGPWYGAFIGAIAGSLADITVAGFALVVPFTLVAKIVAAVAAGYLYKYLPKYIKSLGFLIGGILMAAVYLIFYYFIAFEQNVVASFTAFGFDLAQVLVTSVIAYVLIIPLEKLTARYRFNDDKVDNKEE